MASLRPARVVITGGPGSGKSTLLAALARRRFAVEQEVARAILQKPGGMELRERDPAGFALAMFEAERAAYCRADGREGPTIYDRGLPDIVGFLKLEGLPLPPAIERACHERRYDGPIFHLPPWKAIFRQDAERIQSWDEARVSDAAVTAAWIAFGYVLVTLPEATVEERAYVIASAIA